MAAGAGLAALNVFFDWRRRNRAIDAGTGLAPQSFLVVTNESIYAFDAYLLRWWGVAQPVSEWSRADVVARAVPLARAYNPLLAHEREQRHWPALRLDDRSRQPVAELQPYGWGRDHKEVFETLTGYPGWPPGGDHPKFRPLTLPGAIALWVMLVALFGWRALEEDGGTTSGLVMTVLIASALFGIPIAIAYFKRE